MSPENENVKREYCHKNELVQTISSMWKQSSYHFKSVFQVPILPHSGGVSQELLNLGSL